MFEVLALFMAKRLRAGPWVLVLEGVYGAYVRNRFRDSSSASVCLVTKYFLFRSI